MAKDGRKLELYEILAAKRAKGKVPLGLDPAAPKPQGQPDEPEQKLTDAPGVIIDDSLGEEYIEKYRTEIRSEPEEKPAEAASAPLPPAPPDGNKEPSVREEPPPPAAEPERAAEFRAAEPRQTESITVRPKSRHGYIPVPPEPAQERPDRMEKQTRRQTEKLREPAPAPSPADQPDPEPRPRSPREIVIALDTGLIFFTVILALLGCSYFIGYKRGQEERPAGLAGIAEIETADPNRLNIRDLAPAPRAAVRPPEQDFTLIIRKEPATENDLPERLELELAEAVARGRNAAGRDVPGFIFRTGGGDPQFILAVGLGQNANDQGLNELLQIYYAMEGVTLSREPAPYRGCRIAPVRELGTPVY